MATTLTVYAYGNVDALHGIFNAVAMVMGHGEFGDMIRVAVVIGFIVVATLAALPGNLQKSWNWFLAVAVLSGVMLIPKAAVSIEDKLGHQPTVVVANVPWTLAMLASVKSAIGATLTQMFETAFQTIPALDVALPPELSYLENGVMFGSRLVRTSRQAEPLSLYAKGDLVQYVRNCIFPEQGRTATADAMENSTDLTGTFASMNNPALSSSYHDAAAGWVLVTASCDVVWAKIVPMLNTAGAEAVKQAAQVTMPDLYKVNPVAAEAQLSAALPAIYGKAALASAASTASQIMVQNILINATAEASALYSASLSDPSTIMFASMRTQAVQQMNAGNMVQGRIAEEALPIVRNVTEGILYAVFPVLCILLVASEGRALGALFKSYVYALVWVELWPPMFAVVNYLQTLEAAKAMAGAAYMGGGGTGLTLGTASPIFSASVSTLATSAWMVTFVPVIAAAVLFGFDKIMAITGATGGGIKASQGEAANATKGNLQAGNVSFDQQQLAAYKSDPAMYRTESQGGVEFKNGLTGQTLGQYRQASTPVSLSDTVAVTRGMAVEASASLSSARRNGKAYEQSLDAAYGTALAAVQGNAASASRSLGFDVSRVGSEGVSSSEVDEAAKRIAVQHGVQDASEVSKAIGAGLKGLPIPVLGASAQSSDKEGLTRGIGVAVDSLKKTGAQRKQELVEQFRSGEGFESARRSNRDATQRVESSWRQAEGYRRSEQADLARSQQLSSKVEGAERFARESSARWDNLVDQFARARFNTSAHDGIADPRKWQQIVRSFVEAGSVRTDTDDGRLMWIPPDPGLGSNAVNSSLGGQALATARGGDAAVEDGFSRVAPGGGETAIKTRGDANAERATAEQQRLGLSPTGEVRGQDVMTAKDRGQRAAAAGAAAAKSAVKRDQGDAQLAYDNRTGNVSDFHRPIGSSRNKALDAAKGTDGSSRAFPDEAAAEQTRRDDAAKRFYDEAKNSTIPGAPPPRSGGQP